MALFRRYGAVQDLLYRLAATPGYRFHRGTEHAVPLAPATGYEVVTDQDTSLDRHTVGQSNHLVVGRAGESYSETLLFTAFADARAGLTVFVDGERPNEAGWVTKYAGNGSDQDVLVVSLDLLNDGRYVPLNIGWSESGPLTVPIVALRRYDGPVPSLLPPGALPAPEGAEWYHVQENGMGPGIGPALDPADAADTPPRAFPGERLPDGFRDEGGAWSGVLLLGPVTSIVDRSRLSRPGHGPPILVNRDASETEVVDLTAMLGVDTGRALIMLATGLGLDPAALATRSGVRATGPVLTMGDVGESGALLTRLRLRGDHWGTVVALLTGAELSDTHRMLEISQKYDVAVFAPTRRWGEWVAITPQTAMRSDGEVNLIPVHDLSPQHLRHLPGLRDLGGGSVRQRMRSALGQRGRGVTLSDRDPSPAPRLDLLDDARTLSDGSTLTLRELTGTPGTQPAGDVVALPKLAEFVAPVTIVVERSPGVHRLAGLWALARAAGATVVLPVDNGWGVLRPDGRVSRHDRIPDAAELAGTPGQVHPDPDRFALPARVHRDGRVFWIGAPQAGIWPATFARGADGESVTLVVRNATDVNGLDPMLRGLGADRKHALLVVATASADAARVARNLARTHGVPTLVSANDSRRTLGPRALGDEVSAPPGGGWALARPQGAGPTLPDRVTRAEIDRRIDCLRWADLSLPDGVRADGPVLLAGEVDAPELERLAEDRSGVTLLVGPDPNGDDPDIDLDTVLGGLTAALPDRRDTLVVYTVPTESDVRPLAVRHDAAVAAPSPEGWTVFHRDGAVQTTTGPLTTEALLAEPAPTLLGLPAGVEQDGRILWANVPDPAVRDRYRALLGSGAPFLVVAGGPNGADVALRIGERLGTGDRTDGLPPLVVLTEPLSEASGRLGVRAVDHRMVVVWPETTTDLWSTPGWNVVLAVPTAADALPDPLTAEAVRGLVEAERPALPSSGDSDESDSESEPDSEDGDL